tara:strand:- start:15405 stop:15881 length:477 start_codon:yes stop_codon:yes gene_type:complete
MIKGFEHETSHLSEYEKSLVPYFVQGFEKHKGKKNSITSIAICESMTNLGYKVSEARVRKIVNFVRINHLCPVLLASNKGYWVSDDETEVKDWLESMENRIDALKYSHKQVTAELKAIQTTAKLIPQGFQTTINQNLCNCSEPHNYEGICGECGLQIN